MAAGKTAAKTVPTAELSDADPGSEVHVNVRSVGTGATLVAAARARRNKFKITFGAVDAYWRGSRCHDIDWRSSAWHEMRALLRLD